MPKFVHTLAELNLISTYLLQQKTCNFSYDGVGATMTGIVIIPSGSETSLQAAVASAGPVAVAVDARTNGFRVSIPSRK